MDYSLNDEQNMLVETSLKLGAEFGPDYWREKDDKGEFIGLEGKIKKIGPMAMKSFNCVGDVLTVKGKVTAIDKGIAEIEQWIESERGVTTTCISMILEGK